MRMRAEAIPHSLRRRTEEGITFSMKRLKWILGGLALAVVIGFALGQMWNLWVGLLAGGTTIAFSSTISLFGDADGTGHRDREEDEDEDNDEDDDD